MGFKKEKYEVLKRLLLGNYLHEARSSISEKNLLQTGKVSAETVAKIINKARGGDYSTSPHHFVDNIEVHILRKVTYENKSWYIKWYSLEPDLFFISVHA
ncbi:MAG: hypothetical protein COA36_03755 [Desulfotalea sp.]|nr:MAG: hypothetical protein COA36_03755 [Desulfotalea sp.]